MLLIQFFLFHLCLYLYPHCYWTVQNTFLNWKLLLYLAKWKSIESFIAFQKIFFLELRKKKRNGTLLCTVHFFQFHRKLFHQKKSFFKFLEEENKGTEKSKHNNINYAKNPFHFVGLQLLRDEVFVNNWNYSTFDGSLWWNGIGFLREI
jgi:hypothetical protein